MITIDMVQERSAEWVEDTFGVACLMDKRERGLRILEEAMEYAQTVGIEPEMVSKISDHVFSRPVGESAQELAGITVTVMAAAEAEDIDLAAEVVKELTRVEAKTKDVLRVRQNRKKEAGISQY